MASTSPFRKQIPPDYRHLFDALQPLMRERELIPTGPQSNHGPRGRAAGDISQWLGVIADASARNLLAPQDGLEPVPHLTSGSSLGWAVVIEATSTLSWWAVPPEDYAPLTTPELPWYDLLEIRRFFSRERAGPLCSPGVIRVNGEPPTDMVIDRDALSRMPPALLEAARQLGVLQEELRGIEEEGKPWVVPAEQAEHFEISGVSEWRLTITVVSPGGTCTGPNGETWSVRRPLHLHLLTNDPRQQQAFARLLHVKLDAFHRIQESMASLPQRTRAVNGLERAGTLVVLNSLAPFVERIHIPALYVIGDAGAADETIMADRVWRWADLLDLDFVSTVGEGQRPVLSCRNCGEAFLHSGRGRPPKSCPACRGGAERMRHLRRNESRKAHQPP